MPRYKSVHTGLQIDSGVARALPGGGIDLSLANKVEFDSGFLQSGSIKSWAESKTLNTNAATNSNVTDLPYTGYWGVNFYFYPADSWRVLIATDIQGGKQFYTIKNGVNPWVEWKTIATATPPTEYDLPLAGGHTSVIGSAYWKNQFGEVGVKMYITHSTGITNSETVATLPVGFRPTSTITAPCTFIASSGMACGYGQIIIPTTGEISAEGVLNGAITVTANPHFVAGN